MERQLALLHLAREYLARLDQAVEAVDAEIGLYQGTKAAIEEVVSGKNPEKVYTDIDEMFNDILNEEE